MLTLAEIDLIRAQPHRAVLLYLTGDCPVGCAHCSVNALPRAPRREAPRQRELLDRMVDGIALAPQVTLAGISGGEPFMERRALEAVTARLAHAGKRLVLYTSGNWGRADGTAPAWTAAVLARCDTIVLSTDRFHAGRVRPARFVAALRAARAAGAWVAVQVIGTPAETAQAERHLAAAFGPSWRDHAELRRTVLLRKGRAAAAAPDPAPPGKPASDFGPCPLARSPVVRYDGRVTACCDEDVVTGHGPAPLRTVATTSEELAAALGVDPYFEALAIAGPGALTSLPRYRHLRERTWPGICDLCWALLRAGAHDDPAARAMGMVLR